MNSMILLAAGKGQRVGAAINKMLIKVQGKPIFWHSLQHILTSQLLNEIIVVVQERERPEFESIIRSFNSNILFHIAIGGNTRQASVYNGLKLVSPQTEKIIVHERNRKGSQTSKQKIEIYFNFIGNYEPPKEELTEEEEERLKIEEEERKIKERKDRLHQNYLKRKVNGKQQEYEERYKARREQRKQEKLKVLKRAGIQVNKLEKRD